MTGGSEGAFRELMERYQHKVLTVCAGFFPNRQDAEDATQETFIEIWRSAGQFRQEARLSTWIYRVAVAKSLDILRYRKRAKRAAFFRGLVGLDSPEVRQKADAYNLPGVALENKERNAILHRNLEKLPEKQRTALILQKMEGLSQPQIAQVLEVSEGAVEGLLARGKENLRKHLETYYLNNEL